MGVFGALPPRLARLAYPPPGTPLQRARTPIQATKRPNPNNLPPTHKSPLKCLILRYSPIRLPRHPKTHAPGPATEHTRNGCRNDSDRAHPERLDTSGRLILISFYGYPDKVTAHRRHRGQKKTPRAEARSVTPSIYSFSTGQREPQKAI